MTVTHLLPASDTRVGRFLRLFIAVAIAQAAYWLLFEPLITIGGYPDDRLEISQMTLAHVDSPDFAALDRAEWVPFEGYERICCDGPGYIAVRTQFDLDTIPAGGLGMPTQTQAGNVEIELNGVLLLKRGRMELPDITYHGTERDITLLPPQLLRTGANELIIIGVADGVGDMSARKAILAPYASLESFYSRRAYIITSYYVLSYTVGLVLALLTLIVLLHSNHRRLPFWLVVLLVCWSFRLIVEDSTARIVTGYWRDLVWPAMGGVLPVVWLNLMDSWTERRWRWITPVSLTALTGFLVLAWFMVFRGFLGGLAVLEEYSEAFGGAVILVLVVRLLWHFLRYAEQRYAEAAVLLLVATLIGFSSLRWLLDLDLRLYFDTALPLMLVAFATAFLSRNIRLFRSMDEYNTQLATELAAREREIADSYAERQEVARQQALLTERQRIMRDMHDGMGGRLMSIAAQLKSSDQSAQQPEQLADELMEALDELRLIVDSLDTAGDDLGMALGAFRARMESKLTAAGIESEWTIDEVAAETSLSAGAILDIYRIMQEACANMLRYSGANHFEVALRMREDGAVVLEMADNGKGLEEGESTEVLGGKGLANMRSRAARLGGQIGFALNAPGLKISLLLPPAGRATNPAE